MKTYKILYIIVLIVSSLLKAAKDIQLDQPSYTNSLTYKILGK